MGQSFSLYHPENEVIKSYDREWMEYVRKWIVLDSIRYKEHMLAIIDNDLMNETQYDYETFCETYGKFEKNMGGLGKAAILVTKNNFMMRDSRKRLPLPKDEWIDVGVIFPNN